MPKPATAWALTQTSLSFGTILWVVAELLPPFGSPHLLANTPAGELVV